MDTSQLRNHARAALRVLKPSLPGTKVYPQDAAPSTSTLARPPHQYPGHLALEFNEHPRPLVGQKSHSELPAADGTPQPQVDVIQQLQALLAQHPQTALSQQLQGILSQQPQTTFQGAQIPTIGAQHSATPFAPPAAVPFTPHPGGPSTPHPAATHGTSPIHEPQGRASTPRPALLPQPRQEDDSPGIGGRRLFSSFNFPPGSTVSDAKRLPDLLRNMADSLEKDIEMEMWTEDE